MMTCGQFIIVASASRDCRLFASGLSEQTILMSGNRLEGVVYHGTRPEVTEDGQVLPNSLVYW